MTTKALRSATTRPVHRRSTTSRAITAEASAADVKLFRPVRKAGLTLPDVEATTRYDGSLVLKLRGCFLAGLAVHPSVEPGTLVVRSTFEDRAWLLDDAPETYYLTDYYRRYPLVLVRLARLTDDALRDLLASSCRLTLAKSGARRASHPRKS
jgi:hypothetical protein